MTSPTWIDSDEALAGLARAVAGDRVVAMDSESDSLHHFREKVCLLQVGTARGEVFLVDTLAVRDLAPLAAVVADPAVEKVLHGADYDVATLGRDFAFSFQGLFDTMVACRFLDCDGVGLAAVVEREFGVRLSKGSRTEDWSHRPLAPDLVDYAAADVAHLVALRDRLVERLAAAGREAWVREESAAIASYPVATSTPAPADPMRAPGSRDLDPVRLSVLKALFAAREDLAMRLDRPRFKVAGDDVLVAIARRVPGTSADLAAIPRLPRSGARHADAWLAAVRLGLAAGPAREPLRRHEHRRWPQAAATRAGRLRAWRARDAQRLGLDPGLLLPNRLITLLAEAGPTDIAGLAAIPGIRRWRVEAAGSQMLDAMWPQANPTG